MIKIVHDLSEWGAVARELGPGTNWHEPDNYGIMGRFDGTDGDLDTTGTWPMDVGKALMGGHVRGYDHSPEGAPRRGEMAIVLSHDTYENGYRYRGPDVAAVNVAQLLGWAAEAAQLRELAEHQRQEITRLKQVALLALAATPRRLELPAAGQRSIADLEAEVGRLRLANQKLSGELRDCRDRPWQTER